MSRPTAWTSTSRTASATGSPTTGPASRPKGRRTITDAQLQRKVCRTANALVELGVQPGDRVMIDLPMIPEVVVAMLVCPVGAPHSVVFGGFSAQALVDRITYADAKVVITSDGGYRRGAPSALKPAVDEAVARCAGVEHVLVVRRTDQEVAWGEKDVWVAKVRRLRTSHCRFEKNDSAARIVGTIRRVPWTGGSSTRRTGEFLARLVVQDELPVI